MAIVAALVFAAPFSLAGCGGAERDDVDHSEAYAEEIQTWRKERIERLKSPTGWLSLAGLHWLREGTSTIGSDPSGDIVFSEDKAPALLGTITVDDGVITMDVARGVEVISAGKPVMSIRLYHDGDEDHDTTVLEHGTLTWYAIERWGRLGIRAKDSESKHRREFAGIESYPVDRRWRIDGVLEPHVPPKTVEITNVLGIVTHESSPGSFVFEIDGRACRLDPIADPGDEKMFLIFGDETNGRETYGGGRFVYVDWPGDDGKIVIDFNKAYNPPCALTEYTTCPLPPFQNRLPLSVRAGEKAYKKPGH